MKSADQHLLEEAYGRVRTGHLDRYGKFIPKSNYKPSSDDDDRHSQKVQNDDRNAGLEDDYEETVSPDSSPSFEPKSSPTPSTPSSSIDLSILSGKTFDKTMWDYPDYVITVDGKPRGRMMSREEAEILVSILNSVSKDTSMGMDPKVQNWLSSVEKMGDKL
jgi:hypothetical protein